MKCPKCLGKLKTVPFKAYLKCEKCGYVYWMNVKLMIY